MSFDLSLECTCGRQQIDNTFIDSLFQPLLGANGLQELVLYSPAESHDPFLSDGAGPTAVCRARLRTLNDAQRLVQSELLDQIRGRLIDVLGDGTEFVHECMENKTYPVPAARGAASRVSYLVNYHRPAHDEQAFIDYYCAHHPALMLRFPGLQRLELGLPCNWQPNNHWPYANRMLFCEVSFASVETLNSALASAVRLEMRKDFAAFPPYRGVVTHFPMYRWTRLP